MTSTAAGQPGGRGLSAVQNAVLDAGTKDGSDRVWLVAELLGEVDLDMLTQALMELRGRHDVLRMTVRDGDDGPVGIVGTRTVLPVELAVRPPHPAHGFPPRPFDLANGPLLHVAVFCEDSGRTVVGFQAHSIVLDEQALRHVVHEVGLLYRYVAGEGPMPPTARIRHQEQLAASCSTPGRVPRRMPVASHEIGSDTADRVRLIASSRGLPVSLLVLAAWIAASSPESGTAAVPIAASLPDQLGTPPPGRDRDRVLLPASRGSGGDIAAGAEHLHTATADAPLDDGGTPVTFTFHDDRAAAGTRRLRIVEAGSMLAPSEVSLAAYGTPTAGWLLRLTHRADAAGAEAARVILARTAALLESAGRALIDEELL